MASERSAINTNVLSFPASSNIHFRLAIDAYKEGNVSSALKEAKQALESGEGHANSLLGAIYEHKSSFDQDSQNAAFFYYQQGVRDVGALECWLGVARCHYLGIGTQRDFAEAFHCYEIIAEDSRHPVALLMLGKMYLDGQGVAKNIELAEHYLELAKRHGQLFAYSYLGTIYFLREQYIRGFVYRCIAVAKAAMSKVCKDKKALRRI